VRDAIRQHAMMQMEQQNQSYARGPPPQMSLYQAPPVDMVDSFVRNYRPDPYQGEPLPPPGYGARPPYAGAPYGSYDREAAPYQQYPAPYPPPQQQYPPQRYGQPQYPPMQLQRGNFYPDQNPDVSLVSESRLIPNNPWSSSDILSSLVPIGARAAQAANAAAESQARQYAGRAPSDLEKSLASESEFIYLGRRTPAANEVIFSPVTVVQSPIYCVADSDPDRFLMAIICCAEPPRQSCCWARNVSSGASSL
jgi:hypothetical protein